MSALAQRREAMAKGQARRMERAAVRQRLAARGTPRHLQTSARQRSWQEAAQLVRETPDALLTMAVFDLLRVCHGTGRTLARTILRKAKLPEQKPLGTLTKRQRNVLAGVLTDEGSEAA